MISRRDALKLGAAGLVSTSGGQVSHTHAAAFIQEPIQARQSFRAHQSSDGATAETGPSLDKPIVVKWRFHAQDTIFPPAHANGVLYAGSNDNNLYAINAATGEEIWRYSANYSVGDTPLIANDRVYTAYSDYTDYEFGLIAIDAVSGQESWHIQKSGAIWKPVSANGVLYAGSGTGELYSLDAESGQEIWQFRAMDSISTPIIQEDVLYAGSTDNNLYAIDATSGQEIWRFSASEQKATPVFADGTLYAGSRNFSGPDSLLHAIDATTGALLWTYTASNTIFTPAVAGGIVYAGSGNFDSDPSNLYALDAASGQELWQFPANSYVFSPAVVSDIVYAGSFDHHLYAIDAFSGDLIWSYTTNNGPTYSPTVVGDTLFVASVDRTICAMVNIEDFTPTLLADVTLRAAPSDIGVERGTAAAGTEITKIGNRSSANNQEWVEVTIGNDGGWIPLEAIDPASLAPEGDVEYVYVP